VALTTSQATARRCAQEPNRLRVADAQTQTSPTPVLHAEHRRRAVPFNARATAQPRGLGPFASPSCTQVLSSQGMANMRCVPGVPLDLIVCPMCHGELLTADGGSRCGSCGHRFDGGPLDLTPLPPPDEELQRRWSLWEQLQANFVTAAAVVPEHSLSVTERPDANAFARFCGFSGIVLDVGCGTQRFPTYADTQHCRFVGIDPLEGEADRQFEFVMGIGEYLPFRTNSFDQVLFATSLDHMLIPDRAIAEAARVTRPGGAVNVWFGELDRKPDPVQRLRTLAGRALEHARLRQRAVVELVPEAEYLARIEQPEGAVDKFHVAHPDAKTIAGWLAAAGLRPVRPARVEYAHSCFVRGTKVAASHPNAD
jgi:ubiquinone/menaquinone biosynthesis C-methylase UbiE